MMPRPSLSLLFVVIVVALGCGGLGCGSVAAKHDGGGTGGATGIADAGAETGGDATAASDAAVDTRVDTGASDARASDGPGADVRTAACNPTAAFGAPTLVAGLNSTSREDGLSLTSDRLIAFFSSFRGGTGTVDHIYTAARSAPDQTFGTPAPVTSIMGSATANDFAPRISPDGLRLYFSSTRSGARHIFLATRGTLLTDFVTPAQVAVVNSAAEEFDEHLTGDEQTMVFASTRAGGLGVADLYVSQRTAGGFGAPALITEVSSAASDFLPVLSDDRLTIYFGSDRANAAAKGGSEIWIARRTTPTGIFAAPQLVADLNSPLDDYPVWISPDACTVYFASGPTTATDLFQATRGP
jgi:hypothetical protein